jgi:hypothetical protein
MVELPAHRGFSASHETNKNNILRQVFDSVHGGTIEWLSYPAESENHPHFQGVWLEMSLDGGGVKDELDGLGRVALVVLEPT